MPAGLLPLFRQSEPNLFNKGLCWLGYYNRFIPLLWAVEFPCSPLLFLLYNEKAHGAADPRNHHMAWTQRQACLIRNVTSVTWLSLGTLTHQNCYRKTKKSSGFFFFHARLFFSIGFSTTFVHISVRCFTQPPENPIVFQIQFMLFRSALIEPFIVDVLNTSRDWPGNGRGANQQTSSEYPMLPSPNGTRNVK